MSQEEKKPVFPSPPSHPESKHSESISPFFILESFDLASPSESVQMHDQITSKSNLLTQFIAAMDTFEFFKERLIKGEKENSPKRDAVVEKGLSDLIIALESRTDIKAENLDETPGALCLRFASAISTYKDFYQNLVRAREYITLYPQQPDHPCYNNQQENENLIDVIIFLKNNKDSIKNIKRELESVSNLICDLTLSYQERILANDLYRQLISQSITNLRGLTVIPQDDNYPGMGPNY